MIFLEGGNFMGLIILMIFAMVGFPLILFIIGLILLKKKPKTAKILFIIGAIYLIIGIGICGSII